MKRKLLIVVAAVAAFAVVPAAAQAATPHWFKNGVRQASASPLQVVTFGGASDLEQVSGLGKIHCKGVGGGFVENPAPGGEAGPAGGGKTMASVFYTCVAPECEAAIKEKFGVSGRGEVRTEGLPLPQFGGTNGGEGWENKLSGEEVPVGGPGIKETIGKPWTAFPSPNQKEGKTPEGMIRATVLCTIPALKAVAVEAIFEGELSPEIGGPLNGLGAAKPSQTEFLTGGGGSGALHSELAGEGQNAGKIKYLGYNNQELVAAKNN